ncbi:NPC intracellular cholesterol transporter 2-like [Mercenaria mercenaria]|uniref:NPC intracellular cholesterol transporter 2-like n=1 Tax=Mercenaria mercenaria TaxID=6596 RepID=UPI00234F2C27|nr:NPC intracellular cholesterol transporter 2-like [Mercenaria mercenaria]
MDFINTIVCFIFPMISFCQENAVGESIKYTNCGPDTLKNVDMSPCPVQPCTFHKGTNATVTIDFTTDKQVFGITTKVYGIVAGIPIPYQLPKSNGCKGCNLNCPLITGSHRYINVFPVLQSYPEIRIAVKWELVDENNEQLLCFVFPMQIEA